MRTLENTDIQRKAPSVFATNAWHERSDKYKFIPTIQVIDALRDNGFYPVSAAQSRSRIAGKSEFTRHVLRFRRSLDLSRTLQVDENIAEIVLMNSHDGSSAYKLMAGIFRLVCSNGLIVADGQIESIQVRHIGQADLCQEVISQSKRIIEQTPAVFNRIAEFQKIGLTLPEQRAFAESAKELLESDLQADTDSMLSARRLADYKSKEDGTRDLWRTFNVIQENVIKGGVRAVNSQGFKRHTRAVKAVDRDVKLNKALWNLTEKMAEIKAGQVKA